MVKKEVNLSTIGMKKGKQYETIVSTNNSQGMKNASPIGILCSGNDKVICRIFKGGKTLDNILSQKELIINNDVKAFNRGFGYVVETLANFTRFDLVDDNQKEEYLNKFREANRVVRKIGYPEDIQAMNEIKKELMKKGFKP